MSSGPYARRGDRATRRFEDVAEESEEVIGLGVESERVQRAQREGGVANPGVAVVPVSRSTEILGQ